MENERAAREWLLFVGSVVLGLIGVPIFVMTFINPNAHLGKFFEALIGGRDFLKAWVLVLVPYGLIQLGRSILWALRTVRKP